MATWQPSTRVESNRVLELNRGNPFRYIYRLPGLQTFPADTTAVLTLFNTYGQVLGVWAGTVDGGKVSFFQPADVVDKIPAGTSWVLSTTSAGAPDVTVLMQGSVIRAEAPFPDAPGQTSQFEALQYSYNFGTPGALVDPAWRIMAGKPVIYDNSSQGLPNAVAAGSLLNGNLTFFDQVTMMYFAPLNDDPVRLTYNVVKGGGTAGGEAWIVICSSYDMDNSAAIYHRQWFGSGDTVGIATGTDPKTFATRASVAHTTNNLDNFTAEYNPSSNTFSVYVGTSQTPLVSWVDTTNIVRHGAGERYVGFSFKSAALAPGVEVSDWIINDSV